MVNVNQTLLKYREVMELFLDYPNRKMTVREISIKTKIPYTSLLRYIKLLEKTGMIDIEKIGAYNSCRLNENSSLIPQVKKALEAELSHHRLSLGKFLLKARKLKSIEKIILFGSVSAGKENPESDVDVAIVGRANSSDKEKISKIISDILEKDRVNIVPVFLSAADLGKKSQLAKDLKSGEIIYDS